MICVLSNQKVPRRPVLKPRRTEMSSGRVTGAERKHCGEAPEPVYNYKRHLEGTLDWDRHRIVRLQLYYHTSAMQSLAVIRVPSLIRARAVLHSAGAESHGRALLLWLL